MCGIYGWQWKPNALPSWETRYLLAGMLGYANEDRGKDSFGWYSLDHNVIYRAMGGITGDSTLATRHENVICHTRHATVGAKTVENSHPFSIGNIIGAHNGSVSNCDWLNKSRNLSYEVDSQHIFHALNDSGFLDGIYGVGAIEWVDRRLEAGTIRLCRLTPMADLGIAITKHGIVWSSSKYRLEDIMRTCRLEAKVFEAQAEMVYLVKRGTIYTTERDLMFGKYITPPGEEKKQATSLDSHKKRAKDSAETFRQNWDRTFQGSGGELAKLRDAERVEKTIGKDPRPTAPTHTPSVIVKQKDFLKGSVVICSSCYNDISQHESWCPVGRDRTDVGGGVGAVD